MCRCYASGVIKLFSRCCSSRSRQQPAQPAESKQKSSNAVSSADTGAPQLFSEAVIEEVLIRDVLVDTGSGFSMVSSALHDRWPWRPSINLFNFSAPDILGVVRVPKSEIISTCLCKSLESKFCIRCWSSRIFQFLCLA